MSNKEHRRIAFTAGVIDTPDIDWAGTHTRWTPVAGANTLVTGAIDEVSPQQGALAFHFELYDGVGDGASPIAPGAVTIGMQLVTRHVVRGLDTFELGSLQTVAATQRRQVELEVPAQGQSAVRVTLPVGLAGNGAIWVFVSTAVHL